MKGGGVADCGDEGDRAGAEGGLDGEGEEVGEVQGRERVGVLR